MFEREGVILLQFRYLDAAFSDRLAFPILQAPRYGFRAEMFVPSIPSSLPNSHD